MTFLKILVRVICSFLSSELFKPKATTESLAPQRHRMAGETTTLATATYRIGRSASYAWFFTGKRLTTDLYLTAATVDPATIYNYICARTRLQFKRRPLLLARRVITHLGKTGNHAEGSTSTKKSHRNLISLCYNLDLQVITATRKQGITGITWKAMGEGDRTNKRVVERQKRNDLHEKNVSEIWCSYSSLAEEVFRDVTHC